MPSIPTEGNLLLIDFLLIFPTDGDFSYLLMLFLPELIELDRFIRLFSSKLSF